MWEAVKGLGSEGITVVLTTHYMEEADEICDRVAIMDHGKLLAQDTPELLKATLGAQTIFELKLRQMEGSADLVKTIERFPNVASAETISDGIRVFSQGSDGLLPQLVQAAQGLGLRDLKINEPSLETVFIRLTGRDLRE
jgi:ABC-2 type transport system ATP-binding protein